MNFSSQAAVAPDSRPVQTPAYKSDSTSSAPCLNPLAQLSTSLDPFTKKHPLRIAYEEYLVAPSGGAETLHAEILYVAYSWIRSQNCPCDAEQLATEVFDSLALFKEHAQKFYGWVVKMFSLRRLGHLTASAEASAKRDAQEFAARPIISYTKAVADEKFRLALPRAKEPEESKPKKPARVVKEKLKPIRGVVPSPTMLTDAEKPNESESFEERLAALDAWRFGPRSRTVKYRAQGCDEFAPSFMERIENETKSLVYVALPASDPAWNRTFHADPIKDDEVPTVWKSIEHNSRDNPDELRRLEDELGGEKDKPLRAPGTKFAGQWDLERGTHATPRSKDGKGYEQLVNVRYAEYAKHPASSETFTSDRKNSAHTVAFRKAFAKYGEDSEYLRLLRSLWEAIYFEALHSALTWKSWSYSASETAHDYACEFALDVFEQLARGNYSGRQAFHNWLKVLARNFKIDSTGVPKPGKWEKGIHYEALDYDQYEDDEESEQKKLNAIDTDQYQKFAVEQASIIHHPSLEQAASSMGDSAVAIVKCWAAGMTREQIATDTGESIYFIDQTKKDLRQAVRGGKAVSKTISIQASADDTPMRPDVWNQERFNTLMLEAQARGHSTQNTGFITIQGVADDGEGTEDRSVTIQAGADDSDDSPRLLYDRKGAARQLSISVRSLDYLVANRKLPFRKLGKKVMIPYSELVRFASANHYERVDVA